MTCDETTAEKIAGVAEMRPENPRSKTARWCLAQYYAELTARFEEGFDSNVKAYAGEPAHTFFVVAWRGNEAVGCGSLVWSDQSVGEVKRMWVSPPARGLGIARRLLESLETAARAEGLAAVRLDTNRVLTEAHVLYRKAGYAEVDRYSDNPYAHHWFGKKL